MLDVQFVGVPSSAAARAGRRASRPKVEAPKNRYVLMLWRGVLTFIWTVVFVGCAELLVEPAGGRDPASTASGASASMDRQESQDCDATECKSFIAPCRLNDVHSKQNLNLMEERYFNMAQDLRSQGFCSRVPRPLSEVTYGPGTCLFIFMKRPSCR